MRAINRVVFLGSKHLGLQVLRGIHAISPESLVGIVTVDDRDDSRSVFPQFLEFSASSGLPCHVATTPRQAEKNVLQHQPDLCLVVGWYWLIGAKAIEAVPHGFIGIHNSSLPKYRGGSPVIWPIINGESEVGISLFSFTPGMDDGPIWAQAHVPISHTDYISDVLVKLEQRTLILMNEIFPEILEGRAKPVHQDGLLATYCAQRYPNDGLIDWRMSAMKVYDFIRAQSDPYPGAYTILNGLPLKIWNSRLFEPLYYGTPGQVARINSDGVYVICGDHRAIILQTAEYMGERGPAQTFIRSIRTRF